MDGESFDPGKKAVNLPASLPEENLHCPHCDAPLGAKAAFCPACGWSMTPVPPLERAVAAAGYLPILPATIVLLLPTYRRHLFVRFHAWQSIFLWIIFLLLTGAAILLSNIAMAMAFLVFGILVTLAMIFLWFILSLKAWQGERFGLPLFGSLAARMK
jgi:uncharacterized membrane protein